jgi:hypothetical protein
MKPLDKNGREIKVGDLVRLTTTFNDYLHPERKFEVFDSDQGLNLSDGFFYKRLEDFRNGPDCAYHSVEIVSP